MTENNIILNRFFTQRIFSNLLDNKSTSIYNNCVEKYVNLELRTEISNKDIISEVYNYMNKEYRNEYFYKNTLLNKLLLGRHSLNTTTALSEVPINRSKADFVLINGKAIVYEIKTELDTFDRLFSQLADYYKAFDHVSVVTSENNYAKVMDLLKDTNVGISILTRRNTISLRKEPVQDRGKLDFITMFKVLRRVEYEEIIMDYYGELPETNQFSYYKECFKYFKQIPINHSYEAMLVILKKRARVQIDAYDDIVPYELKSLAYFSKYTKEDYTKLDSFLKHNWEE